MYVKNNSSIRKITLNQFRCKHAQKIGSFSYLLTVKLAFFVNYRPQHEPGKARSSYPNLRLKIAPSSLNSCLRKTNCVGLTIYPEKRHP